MATVVTRPYKLRKTWEDSKGQKASFSYIDTAKETANNLCIEGDSYKVWKDGVCVYDPEDDVIVLEQRMRCNSEKQKETESKRTKEALEIIESSVRECEEETVAEDTKPNIFKRIFNRIFKK